MKRRWYLITVSGYGSFGFYGNSDEAEEMRAHKAIWEGGVATKQAIPAAHPMAKEAQDRVRWQRDAGYPLEARELSSIGIQEDQ